MISNRVKKIFALVVLVLVATASIPKPSRAAGLWYVATTGSDSNDCATPVTPCASINAALNKPGFVAGDTIRVALGTYTPVSGLEVVLMNKNATLSGGWDSVFVEQIATSTLDGQHPNYARRGLIVNSGVVAAVDHFVIQNCDFVYPGGGVLNNGNLTLSHSTIRNNVGMEDGGGISNNGTMAMTESVVSGNMAPMFGGGILNNVGGWLFISNSAVVNNNPSLSSGATGGGIYNSGTLVLQRKVAEGWSPLQTCSFDENDKPHDCVVDSTESDVARR